VKRSPVLLAVSLLALLSACGGGSSSAAVQRHGVLVVAIDCLRADRTSLAGYDRDTTPFLDSLASESVVFDRHYTVTPDVLPSHASLLTGCDPRIGNRPRLVGLGGQSLFLPRIVPRLSRTFLAGGYRTAAFPDSPGFSASHGFESGFEQFLNFSEGNSGEAADHGLVAVASRFQRWLRGLGESENWFAYMQVQDLERIWIQEDPANDRRFDPRPELDFVPPLSANNQSFFAVPRSRWNGGASTLGEYEARYDGNLRECDQTLGRLVTWLKLKGYWETTTLVVTGTYGIGFGEEGLFLESGMLTESDLRVPWLIRPAPSLGLPTNLRVDQLTNALDIAPTLLEICNLGIPQGMHGLSHLEAIHGTKSDLRQYSFAAGGVLEGFAVVTKQDHFLRLKPGALTSRALRISYFGSQEGPPQEEEGNRIELRESSSGARLELSPERMDRLTQAGLAWFRWIKKAQDHVHGVGVDEETRMELLRRGLVSSEPGI
jgi:uncharacterized sulfatase